MIDFLYVLGPVLLIAGLVQLSEWRESLPPIVAGVLLVVAAAFIYLPYVGTTAAGLLFMGTPGLAGLVLLFGAVRTRLGIVARLAYGLAAMFCLGFTLLFGVMALAITAGPKLQGV